MPTTFLASLGPFLREEARRDDASRTKRRQAREAAERRRRGIDAPLPFERKAAMAATWNPPRDCPTLSGDRVQCETNSYRGCTWVASRDACMSLSGFRDLSTLGRAGDKATQELVVADSVRTARSWWERARDWQTALLDWLQSLVTKTLTALAEPFLLRKPDGSVEANVPRLVSAGLLVVANLALVLSGGTLLPGTESVFTLLGEGAISALSAQLIRLGTVFVAGRSLSGAVRQVSVHVFQVIDALFDTLGITSTQWSFLRLMLSTALTAGLGCLVTILITGSASVSIVWSFVTLALPFAWNSIVPKVGESWGPSHVVALGLPAIDYAKSLAWSVLKSALFESSGEAVAADTAAAAAAASNAAPGTETGGNLDALWVGNLVEGLLSKLVEVFVS